MLAKRDRRKDAKGALTRAKFLGKLWGIPVHTKKDIDGFLDKAFELIKEGKIKINQRG